MNTLKVFENAEFGTIRTVEINGEPWLVGKDVAVALGYERATKAIQDHVDNEDKDEVPIQDSIGRMQKTPVINESGLYALVLSSKLPSAKKFRRWVTAEVLPSIRKHGGYIVGQENMSGEELLSRAVLFANSKIIELETKNQLLEKKAEEDRPKVQLAEKFISGNETVSVGIYAKMLYDKHKINIGRTRLFEWLRRKGILDGKNIPYQKYMNAGWFKVVSIPNTYLKENIPTTRITAKGQQKLFALIQKEYKTTANM